jgi:hypothetical protein
MADEARIPAGKPLLVPRRSQSECDQGRAEMDGTLMDPYSKERKLYLDVMSNPKHFFPEETPANLETIAQAASDLLWKLPPSPTQVFPVPNNFHVPTSQCTSRFGCPCDFCRNEQWRSEENDLANEFMRQLGAR